MTITLHDRETIEHWFDGHVPREQRRELRVEARVHDDSVDIVELRPEWRVGREDEWAADVIAQLDFEPITEHWTLSAMDAGGRAVQYVREFAVVDGVEPLLDEVARDPRGVFWG